MLTYEENLRAILETTTAGIVKDEVISIAVLSIMKLNNNYYVLKDENNETVKEEEFKVGDEVTSDARRFIVLGTDAGGWYHLWCLDNGLTIDTICSKDLRKTGRSFPQLAELFKQMKEG